MQNRRDRKAAREVNRFIDPTLIEENDYTKKHGRYLPKSVRDLSHIAGHLDKAMRRADPSLPAHLSPSHYAVFKKFMEIALRDNVVEKDVVCPHCMETHQVDMPHVKAEANSIACGTTLMERFFPKLGHVTMEVDVVGQINNISTGIVTIITKFVSPDRRMEAMAEISDFISGVSRERPEGQLSETEDDSHLIVGNVA